MKSSVFTVTEKNGFLPLNTPMRQLPEDYKELEEILANLPELLHHPSQSAVFEKVNKLPLYQIPDTLDSELTQALFRDYSILTAAYILEGKNIPRYLVPQQLSVPFYKLSQLIDEPLIMSYDSYCLYNFYSVDGSQLWENLRLIRKFHGGLEEASFILIHSEIEYQTPDLIRSYNLLMNGLKSNSMAEIKKGLTLLREVQERIIVTQLKMFNASNPKNYVPFVRPWIFGYKNNPDFPNGVVFENCFNNEPQFLRGETGAQSTIIPSLDIVLGISHKDDPLLVMLKELEAYRPVPHRQYLNHLREVFFDKTQDPNESMDRQHRLRKFIQNDEEASRLFNECVRNVFEFRSIHVAYSDVYIARYTDKKEATGGSPYKVYLRKHRDESLHQQVQWFPSAISTKPVLDWDSNNQSLEDLERAENGIPNLLFNFYQPLIQKYGNNHKCFFSKQF